MISTEKHIILPCGTVAQKAEYSECQLTEHIGNPYIEALPAEQTFQDMLKTLSYYPNHHEDQRNWSPMNRLQCVLRLKEYFQAWSRQQDLALRFHMAIRRGYVHRNPYNPTYIARLNEGMDRIEKGKAYFNQANKLKNEQVGFTIIGISGVGKSASINRVLNTYNQVIVHSEYKGRYFSCYQVPWIKIDCPNNGSLGDICINFFLAVDKLLGTNTHKYYGSGKWAANKMLPGLIQTAEDYGLGALIIDEIQNLSLQRTQGAEVALNFFVNLVNQIGLPVIMIGTNKAMPILQETFAQARRGAGIGDMVWERFTNDIPASLLEQPPEKQFNTWRLLIRGAWRYQWTKTPVPYSHEFADLLYEESQGIIDIAIKLYMIAQFRAIVAGKDELITVGRIQSAAKENLQLVSKMLKAIKTGKLKDLAKYPDLIPVNIDKCLDDAAKDLTDRLDAGQTVPISITQRAQLHSRGVAELVAKLLEAGINESIAGQVSQSVLAGMGEQFDLSKAFVEALRLAWDLELNAKKSKRRQPKETKGKSVKRMIEYGDLRYFREEAQKEQLSIYRVLKEHGVIKDIFVEFDVNNMETEA